MFNPMQTLLLPANADSHTIEEFGEVTGGARRWQGSCITLNGKAWD
jgi:hypothetical protein